jgi:ArpU family phage transcriptional regulator
MGSTVKFKRELEKQLYSYRAYMAALENDGPEEVKADKRKKVAAIHRGLMALTYTEKSIIETRFFDPSQPKDHVVYDALGLGATTYYKYKEQALRKMANALNLI